MRHHKALKTMFLFKNTEGVLRVLPLAYCLLFIVSACGNEQAEAPNITRDQLTIEKGKDVEIIYSDSARVKVRVTGPTMLYFTSRDAPKQEFPNGTVTYFYDEFQQEMSVLTGKYAIRDEKNRKVIVRDSVVWESKTDGRLETSEIIWDEATNIIRSTRSCRIIRNSGTISGFNFETDDKLTHWRLLSPKGNFKMGDNLEKQLH
jgi:LPS export ABC transporter protein LptC